MAIQTVTGQSGTVYKFDDKIIGKGGMKDVYFGVDKSFVVAIYRDALTAQAMQRIQTIVNQKRTAIFDAAGGGFWQSKYCWPTDVVTYQGKSGVVVPTYSTQYFFSIGSFESDKLKLKGKEKEGKWFVTPYLRAMLDPREIGSWRESLKQALSLARSVQRLHAAGLAHSDLSYRNVLVDPLSGETCIIDIDGLVVSGVFPPDVVGTPDFIAPEVMRTKHLPATNPGRHLPSVQTDRHALGVLIYMYLLLRHPLKGGVIYDVDDPGRDEELQMGEKALFIEHPVDKANAVNPKWLKPAEVFWGDPNKLPYTITGPHLKPLFDRVFIEGLHSPQRRPIAQEWEDALVRSLDLIQQCSNKNCKPEWFIVTNRDRVECPFCNTRVGGSFPILEMSLSRDGTNFIRENRELVVWHGQALFPHHVSTKVRIGAGAKPEDSKHVARFQKHKDSWFLVNEGLSSLVDVTKPDAPRTIPTGGNVVLEEGVTLRLAASDPSGRQATVKIVNR